MKNYFVSPTQRKGKYYEELALHYLKKQGLSLVKQNFRSRCGEIDLILKEHNIIVFVEVRFRCNHIFGSPVESVTYAKQKKIINTAKLFLQSCGLYEKVSCRFDILGLSESSADSLNTERNIYHYAKSYQYQWIKNAFQ